jgi:drug/metabolite transporter (DMT)-like permease
MSDTVKNKAGNEPSREPNARALTPLDYGLYVTSVLTWGLSWIAMHYQVGEVAPEVSIFWRFAIAAPMLFAVALLRGESLRFSLADHRYFIGLGATIFCINFLFMYYAAQHVASGLLSIVFSLASIGNVVLGALVFGVRINRRIVIGGTLGVIGVAAMFYPELGGLAFDGTSLLGLAFALGGTLSFCIGNMVSVAAQRRKLPIFASTGWGMTYGASIVALLALARGRTFTVEWSVTYLGGLAYLSVVASFVAFSVYFTLLGRIGAARTGYTTVMYPVVALLISTFAEDYRWSFLAALGLAAVLIGNVLVLRAPRA